MKLAKVSNADLVAEVRRRGGLVIKEPRDLEPAWRLAIAVPTPVTAAPCGCPGVLFGLAIPHRQECRA